MDLLINEYKRRLHKAEESIKTLRFKDNANPDYVRLSAKASCYKIIIAELEHELTHVFIAK